MSTSGQQTPLCRPPAREDGRRNAECRCMGTQRAAPSAKLPALGVEVEAVTDFVPAVTAVLGFSVDQRNF